MILIYKGGMVKKNILNVVLVLKFNLLKKGEKNEKANL